MKKLISLLLALVMVLSLATVAFAADGEGSDPETETPALMNQTNGKTDTSGSITISNMTEGKTYSIYKLLHLEFYESGIYNYKIESKWEDFFKTNDALTYFSVDNGYATWVAADDDATVAAFAKKALQYAKDNEIAHEATLTPSGSTTGKFENLTLGYYLIDSSVGALCGLTTTNPAVSISSKNVPPTIDKQVKEDSTGIFGYENSAQVGQTVEFMTVINVHAGAENYILHDAMTDGLSFNGVTSIVHVIPGTNSSSTKEVPSEYYTVVTTGLTDDCDFEIHFTNHFTEHLSTNDKVEIYYNATVTEDAKIGSTGDVNKTWLDYGDNNHTSEKETTTYTYGIDIVKTDDNAEFINGAEFRIYNAETGGEEIKVVQTTKLDDNGNPIYRLATPDELSTGGFVGEPIVVNGIATVIGFDNGIYWLEETKAPATYQIITARKKFTISDANLSATFTDNQYVEQTGVQVVNKQGTKLPQTGATGTAIFIGFGMFVMLTTGVLLITKKRMSMIEE